MSVSEGDCQRRIAADITRPRRRSSDRFRCFAAGKGASFFFLAHRTNVDRRRREKSNKTHAKKRKKEGLNLSTNGREAKALEFYTRKYDTHSNDIKRVYTMRSFESDRYRLCTSTLFPVSSLFSTEAPLSSLLFFFFFAFFFFFCFLSSLPIHPATIGVNATVGGNRIGLAALCAAYAIATVPTFSEFCVAMMPIIDNNVSDVHARTH